MRCSLDSVLRFLRCLLLRCCEIMMVRCNSHIWNSHIWGGSEMLWAAKNIYIMVKKIEDPPMSNFFFQARESRLVPAGENLGGVSLHCLHQKKKKWMQVSLHFPFPPGKPSQEATPYFLHQNKGFINQSFCWNWDVRNSIWTRLDYLAWFNKFSIRWLLLLIQLAMTAQTTEIPMHVIFSLTCSTNEPRIQN